MEKKINQDFLCIYLVFLFKILSVQISDLEGFIYWTSPS